MNQVMLIGRLVKDIEIRYTQDNIAIGNITLAVTRSFKNANGEYESDFINCVIYRETAERVKEYTHKGDLIAVIGRIQTRSYEDKDQKKHYITEVITEKVRFLSMKKKEDSGNNQKNIETNESIVDDPYEEIGKVVVNDEDLPF